MEAPEIIEINIQHYRAMLRLELTEPKRQAVKKVLADAEHDLGEALRANWLKNGRDNDTAWRIESLRTEASQIRARAGAAADPNLKRQMARRALELAQEAEALSRSSSA